MPEAHHSRDVVLHLGHEQITLSQRYELVSIANDILIAVWFTIGSILFFSSETTEAGTWLFLLGSVQLLIRPAIRLTRRIHIQRCGPATPAPADQEF